MAASAGHAVKAIGKGVAKAIAKAPVHAYRWTLKPLIGWECRHLPTCSEYALEAIDRNGAWRGGLAGAVAHLPLPSLGHARVRSGARHYRRAPSAGAVALWAVGLARAGCRGAAEAIEAFFPPSEPFARPAGWFVRRMTMRQKNIGVHGTPKSA